MNGDKKVLVKRRVANPQSFFLPAVEVTEWCRQTVTGLIYTCYEDSLKRQGMYVDRSGTSSYCQSHGSVTNLVVRRKANDEYVSDYCPLCNSGNWTISESDIVSISDDGEEDFSQLK